MIITNDFRESTFAEILKIAATRKYITTREEEEMTVAILEGENDEYEIAVKGGGWCESEGEWSPDGTWEFPEFLIRRTK